MFYDLRLRGTVLRFSHKMEISSARCALRTILLQFTDVAVFQIDLLSGGCGGS